MSQLQHEGDGQMQVVAQAENQGHCQPLPGSRHQGPKPTYESRMGGAHQKGQHTTC